MRGLTGDICLNNFTRAGEWLQQGGNCHAKLRGKQGCRDASTFRGELECTRTGAYELQTLTD